MATVVLLGLPLAVHHRAVEHDQTLRRELALVRAARETDVSARLTELSEDLRQRFGAFTAAQEAALAAAGDQGVIDLAFELPAEAADAFERLAAVLEEADELCRNGELVTVAAPPESVAYRRWLLEEFIEQIRTGRDPRPWAVFAGGTLVDGAATGGPDEGAPLLVDGDLDLFGAAALRKAIAERLEAGSTSITVDLSRCGFVDSVGLSLLLTTRERLAADGGSFAVLAPREAVLRLFETVGVKDLLVRPSDSRRTRLGGGSAAT